MRVKNEKRECHKNEELEHRNILLLMMSNNMELCLLETSIMNRSELLYISMKCSDSYLPLTVDGLSTMHDDILNGLDCGVQQERLLSRRNNQKRRQLATSKNINQYQLEIYLHQPFSPHSYGTVISHLFSNSNNLSFLIQWNGQYIPPP